MCTKRRGAIRSTSSVFTRTFKALSARKHFIFDASVETNFPNGYNRKTGIVTAHQKVCIYFFWTIHAAGVPITLVPVVHTNKRQQCWHKMGLQKGQYMQIQKSKMMKILPRVLWFWLLQRYINFKSFVQWQAKSPRLLENISSGYRNAKLIFESICYTLCRKLNKQFNKFILLKLIIYLLWLYKSAKGPESTLRSQAYLQLSRPSASSFAWLNESGTSICKKKYI